MVCLNSTGRKREKEKALIIHELRQQEDFKALLRLANMPRSTYYYHIKQSKKPDKYAEVKEHIKHIFEQHKRKYGYRRIHLALRNEGITVNHKTALSIMQQMKLKSIIRGKKYKSYRGECGKIAPNILNREFKAKGPKEKLATDITEFKVQGRKLYLSPVIDLFNGEILSYELSESPNFKQVTDMLKKTFKQLKGKLGVILHSDQGWQYQMKQYQLLLQQKSITQSMSRKGNCLDNAIIENFFGTLKAELFYLKNYKTIKELKEEIKDYIKYYNKDRIRLNLNGMSPAQYRTHYYKSLI
ncbi:IS3 family transposase [Solitalea koreensis]|uniref:Putative transposase n=1 Tax=Solitalea koreensis TaxID=543615 RepID=A0A521DLD4_9SPHI|nr:IS3 family transposase [Solitalea koreensis]SMO72392.1 putative transposase [Solitalea koreensis]